MYLFSYVLTDNIFYRNKTIYNYFHVYYDKSYEKSMLAQPSRKLKKCKNNISQENNNYKLF